MSAVIETKWRCAYFGIKFAVSMNYIVEMTGGFEKNALNVMNSQ